jgi:hypothetical protein
VLDDFVKGRAEANSKVARDKTWNWFADDFLTRFAKNSALLAICTRWHIDDLLGRLKKKWPEMKILTFPAFAERDERWLALASWLLGGRCGGRCIGDLALGCRPRLRQEPSHALFGLGSYPRRQSSLAWLM